MPMVRVSSTLQCDDDAVEIGRRKAK